MQLEDSCTSVLVAIFLNRDRHQLAVPCLSSWMGHGCNASVQSSSKPKKACEHMIKHAINQTEFVQCS